MNNKQKLDLIHEILETLKLYIQQDGGDFEFVSYENNILKVKLLGACVGCGSTDVTYQEGLQELLKDEVDPMIKVELITTNE